MSLGDAMAEIASRLDCELLDTLVDISKSGPNAGEGIERLLLQQ
jgi:hypothetical protein